MPFLVTGFHHGINTHSCMNGCVYTVLLNHELGGAVYVEAVGHYLLFVSFHALANFSASAICAEDIFLAYLALRFLFNTRFLASRFWKASGD